MSNKKQIKREPLRSPESPEAPASETAQALQEQVARLQLEVDILKETIDVLKKDPGVNMTNLNNHEKAVVVGALKDKYALRILLVRLDLPRSSYFIKDRC